MTLTNIALIGANGNLGPSVLSSLLAAKNLHVTVISRTSSKSTYPSDIKVKHVPDEPTHAELMNVLRGQDALVTTFAGTNRDLQILLAEASLDAGVKRFIPADFGSCDSSSPRALELVPLYRAKQKVREHLQAMVRANEGFSWTSLVYGHFFDYGLASGLLQFDLEAKKTIVFDDGNVR